MFEKCTKVDIIKTILEYLNCCKMNNYLKQI